MGSFSENMWSDNLRLIRLMESLILLVARENLDAVVSTNRNDRYDNTAV